MKPEAQRIAIAEACGWTSLWWAPVGDLRDKPELHGKPPGKNYDWLVPDYLSDLNAVHEAEKMFTNLTDGYRYDAWLRWVTHPKDGLRSSTAALEKTIGEALPRWPKDSATAFYTPLLWSATAAQRAEAFLRTMGKWEDS